MNFDTIDQCRGGGPRPRRISIALYVVGFKVTKIQVSTASDVWSYGVALWEIYSKGKLPYRDTTDVPAHFEAVQNGLRLEKPDECSRDL